jgi:hypothetical protein
VSFSQIEAWKGDQIINTFSSAVYQIGDKHELVLSPMIAEQMQNISGETLDSSFEARAEVLSLIVKTLRRLDLFIEEPTLLMDVDEQIMDVPDLADAIRRRALAVPEVDTPTDPASQGRKFMLQKELQNADFVHAVPGTPGPELLAYQGQAPIQKLHSFMVGNVSAEVKDLKRDILHAQCKDWAAERYPKADASDFKDNKGGGPSRNKVSYDRAMDMLRKLHVVDSLYGEQCPQEARAMLFELKDELERSAVTELAFAKSSEAGQCAKLLLGRKTANSFLDSFSDELHTVFSASAAASSRSQKQPARAESNRGTLANVSKRQEHQESVSEREAKRFKQEKAKSEATAASAKAATQVTAGTEQRHEPCELCNVRHIGGLAQCVYNPQSPQYNTAFGEERRNKAFGGATRSSQLRQSVFRRIDSSTSGATTSGSGGGKGKGGSRASKH